MEDKKQAPPKEKQSEHPPKDYFTKPQVKENGPSDTAGSSGVAKNGPAAAKAAEGKGKKKIMTKRILCVALVLGALIGCNTAPKQKRADSPETMRDDVPFVGLGYAGYEGMFKRNTRQSIAAEIFRRMQFGEDYLNKGTPYIPELQKPSDQRSVVAISNGTVKLILVTAFVYDNTANKVRTRHGLIPYSEYQQFLWSIAR